MLVGPMKKRIFLAGIIGFLVMLLIASGVVFFLWKKYDAVKQELDKIENSKISVYVLKRDIQERENIKIEDIEEKRIHKDNVPKNAYTNENIDKSNLKNKEITRYAKINIKAGTILTEEMMYDENVSTNDLRTQEYNMVLLPTNLRKNSYVDIRLLLPSGNDYVVASKKRVIQSTERTIWLNLDEVDMQYMNCAIIESYATNGSILYAIEYADPTVQTAAKVTYPVLRAVAALIVDNPNIIESIKQELTARFGPDSTYQIDRETLENNVVDFIPIKIEDKIELISGKVLEQIKLQQEERQNSLEKEAAAITAAAQQTSAKQNSASASSKN